LKFIVELLQFGFLGLAVIPLVAFGLAGNLICSVLMPIFREKEVKLKTTVIGTLLAAALMAALMIVVSSHGLAHLGERIRFTNVMRIVIFAYFWNCYFIFVPQWLFLLIAKSAHFTGKAVIGVRLVFTLLCVLLLGFAHSFIGRSIFGLPTD